MSSASESRTYGAQAQYRLGLCLLKKGDSAEAVKAFEALVLDYPEQKDLMTKARQYIPAESSCRRHGPMVNCWSCA